MILDGKRKVNKRSGGGVENGALFLLSCGEKSVLANARLILALFGDNCISFHENQETKCVTQTHTEDFESKYRFSAKMFRVAACYLLISCHSGHTQS